MIIIPTPYPSVNFVVDKFFRENSHIGGQVAQDFITIEPPLGKFFLAIPVMKISHPIGDLQYFLTMKIFVER